MFLIEKSRPLLIVDSDPNFLQDLHADPCASLASPLVTRNAREAQAQLADRSQVFSGIFINPKSCEAGGLSIVHAAHSLRAGTPVYFLCDKGDAAPVGEHALKSVAVHQVVRKPVRYSDLIGLVAPLISMFDVEKALTEARRNTDPVESEISAQDTEFVPVLAENFLSGRKTFFDIYVRLKRGRYVKILAAGDAFSGERLLRYVQKGVLHFYLRKDAQESYLDFCSQLSTAILKSNSAPPEVKASQVMNLGEQSLLYLQDRCERLTPSHVKYAIQFSSNSLKLAEQFETAGHDFLRGYLKNVAACGHGAATAMIAALLVHPLQIQSERLRTMVGVSALLHDLGLPPELAASEHAESDCLHPERGAQMLTAVKGFDAIAAQAVAQHHCRRDGSGFPPSVQPDALTRLGEIIGISDEFVAAITHGLRDPGFDPLAHMERKVFNGFSYPVIHAFRAVFLPKPKQA